MDKTITIKTFVAAGRGLASSMRASDMERLAQIQGRTFFKGSLNLISKQPVWLNTTTADYATENGRHFYWNATLNGIPVVINRWAGAPAHVFEIFAEEKLRTKLQIDDGDPVALSIPQAIIHAEKSRSLRYQTSWFLCWRGREAKIYTDDSYCTLLNHRSLRRLTWRTGGA